jgi:pyruvate/2-oxoglutarate dehydrogenase complex dihydrolipoamide dehydrogenase (E3) component
MKKYDAIIIGSGQAGNPLAKKLAGDGWKTAIIEKSLVGGTCINYGCTPTKAMVASARMAYLAANSKEYGIPVRGFEVDIKAVINRKNKIVTQFHDSTERQLTTTKGLDLIYGEASFTSADTISIALTNGGKKQLTAKHIFIDTGLRTAIPAIEGLEAIDYLTSTIFIHSPRFLPNEDEDIAQNLLDILTDEGISIHTKANVEKITKNKQISIRANVNKKTLSAQCSHVLIAAGRTPNTDRLNLEAAGIKTDAHGYILVNNKLETSVKGIYALGDVKGGPAFTHIAYNDHLVIAKNLLRHARATIKDRPVPYCMYTDPQLGRVGMTETQARAKGYNIDVAILPMKYVARAIETGDTRGMMKAVADAKTGKILGVAIIGTEGGEIMSVMQMAMAGGLTHRELREMVFAHPAWSESINNLFMKLDKI